MEKKDDLEILNMFFYVNETREGVLLCMAKEEDKWGLRVDAKSE